MEVAELRERAVDTFHVFDPFLGREVEFRGLILPEFIAERFDPYPERLAFTTWDDYEATLESWDDPNWILVTHMDGKPLGLRQRGPLRLAERDHGDRDPGNLRNFNDWIWMIRGIEALR